METPPDGHCCGQYASYWNAFLFRDVITARKQSLGQGNIFTPVCHSVHRGEGACVVARGMCMVAPGAGGVGGCACLLRGGHAWFYLGGHAWFYSGGACVVFSVFFRYNEIRSMSGWYASYWNAFLW